jgi:hypothetical protein
MPASDPLAIVRYLDVVIIVLAAPFVILTGAPVVGYLAAAGAWIVTRVAGVYLDGVARRRVDPRQAAGINLAMLMGRAWILGLTILVVGLTGTRKDGLMAALLALVVFTVYFITTLVLKPLERNTPRS